MNEPTNETAFLSKRLNTTTQTHLDEMMVIASSLQEAGDVIHLYFQRLRDIPEPQGADATINLALFRDGIIQLMSCFNTNPKKRDKYLIPEEIYTGTIGWEKYYQWLLDTRDAFAAHNFGVKRQANATVVFHPKTLEVQGIAVFRALGRGEEISAETNMKRFWKQAWDHLESRMAPLREQLLEEAKSLTHDQIKALEDVSLRIPEPHEIRTSREKWKK